MPSDRIPGIESAGAGDWVRMMLHSFPGWGKTSLIATCAELGPTLLIRSSMDQVPSRALKHKNLEQFVADNWVKMSEIEDFARMANHGYEWIWWDCVSLAQDMLLDDIWEGTVAEKPSRAFKVDDNGKILGPNLTPSSGLDRGEYGRNMERIQRWVRHMCGAKKFHFGIVGHSAELANQVSDEGGVFLQPWIQGREMIPKICGYMNLVAFLELEGEGEDQQRVLHTAPNPRWYAKDLFDAVEEGQMENPSMPKLVAAIEAARGRPLGESGRTTSRASRRAPAARGRGAGTTATARGRGKKGA